MKNLLVVILSILPYFAVAQLTFTIKGQIQDLKHPAKAYLAYEDGDGASRLDSVFVNQGKFVFKGEIALPTRAILSLLHGQANDYNVSFSDAISLYLEDGDIQVITKDSLKNAEIIGGISNTDLIEYKNIIFDVRDQNRKVYERYQAASIDQKNDPAFMDSIQQETENIQTAQKEADFKYISEHPNKLLSLDLLMNYLRSSNFSELNTAFDGLTDSLKASHRGIKIAEIINAKKNLVIGGTAPDFSLRDVAGNERSLSSLKGKYVLLDFWASWCVPCRDENSHMLTTYRKFKNKNFTVLSVSVDNSKTAWLNAIKEDGIQEWLHVIATDQGSTAGISSIYGIVNVPINFLLDPEGKIIAKNLWGSALSEKLASLLK